MTITQDSQGFLTMLAGWWDEIGKSILRREVSSREGKEAGETSWKWVVA
jgi:hypothetical protein